MNNYPFWYKLIYQWVCIEGNSGLSLPFLLGALHEGTDSLPEITDTRMLINEMEETESPEIITIKYCPDLDEPVFGLEERSTKFSLGFYMSDNLWIAQSLMCEINNKQELISLFEGKYSEEVYNQTFSKNLLPPRTWRKFNQLDKDLINRAHEIIIVESLL
jgi:hypothetical protein